MRRTILLAAAIALAGTGAAEACCFLKCWCRPAPAAPAAPVPMAGASEKTVVKTSPMVGTTRLGGLQIRQVNQGGTIHSVPPNAVYNLDFSKDITIIFTGSPPCEENNGMVLEIISTPNTFPGTYTATGSTTVCQYTATIPGGTLTGTGCYQVKARNTSPGTGEASIPVTICNTPPP
jgi:hypothetical protein